MRVCITELHVNIDKPTGEGFITELHVNKDKHIGEGFNIDKPIREGFITELHVNKDLSERVLLHSYTLT